MKKPVVFCVCGLMISSLLCAEMATYEWTQANGATSLGDGAVSAVWSGDKVQSFTKVTSDDVAITGDSLDFAAGGIVSLTNGIFSFNLPITAEGALTFRGKYIEEALSIYEGETLSGKTEKLVFEDLDLDEWEPYSCTYNKNNYNGYDYAIRGDGTPFYVVRTEGTLSVQFQTKDGGLTKSVQVLFRQEGEDVYAKITHAKYVSGLIYYEEDFDDIPVARDYMIAADDNKNHHGYGIDYIVFRKIGYTPATAVVKDSVSAAGVITNGSAMNLVFSGEAALSGEEEYAGDFYLENRMSFKNRIRTPLTLTGSIMGDDFKTLAFDPFDGDPIVFEAGVATVIGTTTTKNNDGTVEYKVIGTSWIDVITNIPISSVTGLSGYVKGPNICETPDPHVMFVSNSVDGLVKYYQFQVHDNTWFKVIDVELTQLKPSIYENTTVLGVRVAQALYCRWDQVPGEGDAKFGYFLTLEDAKTKGGSTYSYSGYGIYSVDVSYNGGTQNVNSITLLSGTNYIQKGVMEVSGAANNRTCVKLLNSEALPIDGLLNVRENGIVEFHANGNGHGPGYRSGRCLMKVYPGGELRQIGDFAFGSTSQQVSNKGGKIVLGYGKTSPSAIYHHSADSKTYLSFLTLNDGAVVEGSYYPRIAYGQNARWNSLGAGTNMVNCGIIIAGYDAGARKNFVIDCDGDLALNGPIMAYGDLYDGEAIYLTNCVMQKTGSAKVIQNGRSIAVAPIEVYDGAWVLGGSDLVSESKVFELHGGTLELADDVSQSLDTLPLMTNSVCGVTLGNASALQLGELSFVDAGATLAVTGPEVRNGRRTGLRIGTSATLSESILDKIRYNDLVVFQDSEGWIRVIPDGTSIIIR